MISSLTITWSLAIAIPVKHSNSQMNLNQEIRGTLRLFTARRQDDKLRKTIEKFWNRNIIVAVNIAHFPEALEAFRTAMSFRFVSWLNQNRDVFIAYQASLGLVWA